MYKTHDIKVSVNYLKHTFQIGSEFVRQYFEVQGRLLKALTSGTVRAFQAKIQKLVVILKGTHVLKIRFI